MKAIVCMKQVPDTESNIRLTDDRQGVFSDDFSYIINPYDEFAIEEALKLKEQAGEGEVVLVSVGEATIKSTLQKGMAMGADRSVLLEVNDYKGDALVTAQLLADQIKQMEYDIILCGKQAVDGDDAQVGVILGELLGLPVVSAVNALELADGKLTLQREVEGGHEVYTVSVPAVVTAEKGLNEPRYPTMKGIMQARKKPVENVGVTPTASTTGTGDWSYPPSRAEGKIVGSGADAVPELVRLLKEEAKVI